MLINQMMVMPMIRLQNEVPATRLRFVPSSQESKVAVERFGEMI